MKLIRSRIELPAPRPVPWTMRDLATAETEFRFLADGRLHLRIRHEILHGVTAKMLVWWFSNLEGDIQIGDSQWPRYQIWHPIDHISVRYVRRTPDGTIGPGAQMHIRETFGAKTEYLSDFVSTIQKLDETGLIHGVRIFGQEMVRLEHTFTSVKGGIRDENSLTFGPNIPWMRNWFDRLIRPRVFTDDQARAWLKHNVEEMGNLEFFLPELYAKRLQKGELKNE